MTPSAYLALGLLAVIVAMLAHDLISWRRSGLPLRQWINHVMDHDYSRRWR